jgi:hypothetical protein
VAADAKYNQMCEAPPRTVYIAYGAKWDRSRRMSFAVRSAAAPAAMAIVSGCVPANRAAKIDPIRALRHD